MKKIIEIQEEVRVGNIILEKGDKIIVFEAEDDGEDSFKKSAKEVGITISGSGGNLKVSSKDIDNFSQKFDDILKKFYSNPKNKSYDITWDEDNDGEIIIKKKK